MTYTPRTRPLVPAGHRCWLAVSRVRTPSAEKRIKDFTVDETIEWLLESITAPGADVSQRHDDLALLAEVVINARGNKVSVGRNGYTYDGTESFGYGVQPIDADTHDADCATCGDSADPHGHEPDFDPHPYVYAPKGDAACTS